MDPYAETAADYADSTRAAIAFLRATRDERFGDAELILAGTDPSRLAIQVAAVAVRNYGVTDEFFDRELESLNRADIDGELARFAEENDLVIAEKTPFRPDIIGQTPAGLIVGTVTSCGICKAGQVCCTGEGECIIICHPEDLRKTRR